MLSVAECKEYLKNNNLSDDQVEKIRDFMYVFMKRIITQEVNEGES